MWSKRRAARHDRKTERTRWRRRTRSRPDWKRAVPIGSLALAWPLLGAGLAAAGDAPLAGEESAIVLQLARPDREAAEVLKLFEGAREPSPAAALRAWKQATRLERSLGKPLEALIASFNPAMVSEWRFLDGAELHLGFNARDGAPRWFALVPHDDGTAAAALTAARLTYPDDEPLRFPNGQVKTAVARLSRSGEPLACVAGPTIVLGSSRAALENGVRFASGPAPSSFSAQEAGSAGLRFRVWPRRLAAAPTSGLAFRRVVEALHALGCERAEGTIALSNGRFALDWTATFAGSGPLARQAGHPRPEIDPAWLERIPARRALAFLSLACGPAPEFWDRAFALADRVEKADPSRATAAPIRARLNALALLAGARAEADLWPHLRGLTAGLWHAPGEPGRLGGALLVLHIDAEANAARLSENVLPRFAALLARRAKAPPEVEKGPPAAVASKPGARAPRRLGLVEGRPLTVDRSGRDVLIAWGEAAFWSTGQGAPPRERSCAAVRGDWAEPGRGRPAHAGAFWPGRWLVFLDRPRPASPALERLLAESPPVIWRGWSSTDRTVEEARWAGLAELTRRFLETVAGGPPTAP